MKTLKTILMNGYNTAICKTFDIPNLDVSSNENTMQDIRRSKGLHVCNVTDMQTYATFEDNLYNAINDICKKVYNKPLTQVTYINTFDLELLELRLNKSIRYNVFTAYDVIENSIKS